MPATDTPAVHTPSTDTPTTDTASAETTSVGTSAHADAAAQAPAELAAFIAGQPAPRVPKSKREIPAPGTLPLPPAVPPMRLRVATTVAMGIIHLVACLAFFPAFFSWTGVVLVLVGLYVFGTLGINVGYHRLLTHRGFKCPQWLERTFALLGVCSLEGGPARWVAMHRKHHQHSDEQPDPHSPLVNFLWGHIGWILFENRDTDTANLAGTYARDLMTQTFYRKLEQKYRWLLVYVLHAVIFGVVGLAVGLIMYNADLSQAAMFAASVVIWGVAVRTVVVWHITWSVNSLSHLFGYQSHKTGENSRNNWLVALLSNGEGWHNNHHADQVCVAHGRKWWELDVTYITIRGLKMLGLAWDLRMPGRRDESKPHAHA